MNGFRGTNSDPLFTTSKGNSDLSSCNDHVSKSVLFGISIGIRKLTLIAHCKLSHEI